MSSTIVLVWRSEFNCIFYVFRDSLKICENSIKLYRFGFFKLCWVYRSYTSNRSLRNEEFRSGLRSGIMAAVWPESSQMSMAITAWSPKKCELGTENVHGRLPRGVQVLEPISSGQDLAGVGRNKAKKIFCRGASLRWFSSVCGCGSDLVQEELHRRHLSGLDGAWGWLGSDGHTSGFAELRSS